MQTLSLFFSHFFFQGFEEEIKATIDDARVADPSV